MKSWMQAMSLRQVQPRRLKPSVQPRRMKLSLGLRSHVKIAVNDNRRRFGFAARAAQV